MDTTTLASLISSFEGSESMSSTDFDPKLWHAMLNLINSTSKADQSSSLTVTDQNVDKVKSNNNGKTANSTESQEDGFKYQSSKLLSRSLSNQHITKTPSSVIYDANIGGV